MARAEAHRVGVVGFRSIVGSVILMALVLPGSAFGGSLSILLESNSDESGGSEVHVVSYQSLADFDSNTQTGSGYTAMNVNSTFSVGGFAFDGDQYHIVLESDADEAGGSEVYLISYDSLADVYSNTPTGFGYTALNISGTFSVGGFASDGLQYHIVLESDADEAGGSEVYLISYDSLADVFANTVAGFGFTAMNVNSSFSVGGFAFDGDQYHIVLESDADEAGGSEVYRVSYDSLAKVFSNTQAGSGYTAMNVNSTFSVGGFAGEMPLVADGFESGDTSGWSSFRGGFQALTLLSGQGYDFSEWTSGGTGHGDFYFLYQSAVSRFWANNFGMRGLVDLGVTPGNLADISVPTSGYSISGVEAILHHTYVSLAAVGEDDYYIIFRVTAVSSTATTIEGIYVYRP